MEDKMKILLFYTGRLLNGVGGIERVFSAMASEFIERGHEVIGVGVGSRDGGLWFGLHPRVKFFNIGIGLNKRISFLQRIKSFMKINRDERHCYRQGINDPKIGKRIQPIIESEKPDIIITFNAEATRIIILHTEHNCPVIHTFHENYKTVCGFLSSKTKMAMKQVSCMQALMPKEASLFEQYFRKKVVCIPNAVPQIECSEKENEKEPLIVHVGRICKEKQQHLLIEAFAKIADHFPDWYVEIWGEKDWDEKYYKVCKGLVEKYNLQKRIRFCGVTNDVFGVLKRSAIFAFPSKHEGFGLALAEAMSMGVVPIGYKSCSAVNELIKDGENGVLVEDGSCAFANALAELMEDKDKRARYGAEAKRSMEAYAPEVIWDMWDKLLQETVSEYQNKK